METEKDKIFEAICEHFNNYNVMSLEDFNDICRYYEERDVTKQQQRFFLIDILDMDYSKEFKKKMIKVLSK